MPENLMDFFSKQRIVAVLILLFITTHANAITLKIATITPEGSSWMTDMRAGAEKVAKKTNNRVRFKFYPGGVMGSDKAVLRKIRIGQLHGGAVVAGSLAKFFPDDQVYCLPLKFNSFAEIDYVRERMDQYILDGLEKGGFVAFGLAGGGFAYIMSNAPIKTVEDLSKQKVWIPDNDLTILEAVKAFKVTPIPLSIADVRTGLQTGMINTVTTSPVGAIILQWHTQVKYLTNIPFMYLYATLAVSNKAFKKIAPEDQMIVREIMGNVFSKIGIQNREDNIKALEVIKKQGVKFVDPPPGAINKWRSKAEVATTRLIEAGRISSDVVNTINRHLNDFRAKTPKAK